jgi:formamidopyrimidine-DNA glycosylase
MAEPRRVPELPEVETIRRRLAECLVGRTITGVTLRLPKLVRVAPGHRLDDLIGQGVRSVQRWAKLLQVDVGDHLSLLIHLKMTGQIIVEDGTGRRWYGGHPIPAFDAPMPHKSTHLILDLDDGGHLYLTDTRQFGQVRLIGRAEVGATVAAERHGPDALAAGLTPDLLAARLLKRPRAHLKPVLLDQTIIAGMGNIYTDEALFSARLHPLRTPASLRPDEVARLHAGIRDALEHGLSQGGFTIINGRARPFEGYPRVHGRAGEPCPVCGGPIDKIVVGGRGTYLCRVCQPPP